MADRREPNKNRICEVLRDRTIKASAPCRIDMGGTLDISSLFYPLARLEPCTFNIALDMRTTATVGSFKPGMVKVESRGFKHACYRLEEMPFDHPLGLMFAVAACFSIDGISIEIESASPPKSSLGGSSSAAVALVGAYSALLEAAGLQGNKIETTAVLAQGIEQSIAGVPCGMQDQLAAAYGGINAWHWVEESGRPGWRRQNLDDPVWPGQINDCILVAYCGIPHESADINGTWIRRFLAGKDRSHWADIIGTTRKFVAAFAGGDIESAAKFMNRETRIRRQITPHVVDDIGAALIEAAEAANCGARFAGAGGGGCLWALGPQQAISGLRSDWEKIVKTRPGASVLETRVDPEGIRKCMYRT
ncbi:MAG: galactokinase [Desulfosalsimonas sp.]